MKANYQNILRSTPNKVTAADRKWLENLLAAVRKKRIEATTKISPAMTGSKGESHAK